MCTCPGGDEGKVDGKGNGGRRRAGGAGGRCGRCGCGDQAKIDGQCDIAECQPDVSRGCGELPTRGNDYRQDCGLRTQSGELVLAGTIGLSLGKNLPGRVSEQNADAADALLTRIDVFNAAAVAVVPDDAAHDGGRGDASWNGCPAV